MTRRSRAAAPRRAALAVRVVVGTAYGAYAAIAVAWVVLLDLVAPQTWCDPVGWGLGLAPVALLPLWSVMPERRPKRIELSVSWGALLLCVTVILVPWTDRKRFVNDVFSVRPGMSIDDVEAVMAGYMKGAGGQWHLPEGPDPVVRGPEDPEDAAETETARALFDSYREPQYPAGQARRHFTGSVVYRWSNHSGANADWGLVQFADGKVVKVQFLPD